MASKALVLTSEFQPAELQAHRDKHQPVLHGQMRAASLSSLDPGEGLYGKRQAGRAGSGPLLQLSPGGPGTYSTQLWVPLPQARSGLGHAQSASCCSIKTHDGVSVAGTPCLQSAEGRSHRGQVGHGGVRHS